MKGKSALSSETAVLDTRLSQLHCSKVTASRSRSLFTDFSSQTTGFSEGPALVCSIYGGQSVTGTCFSRLTFSSRQYHFTSAPNSPNDSPARRPKRTKFWSLLTKRRCLQEGQRLKWIRQQQCGFGIIQGTITRNVLSSVPCWICVWNFLPKYWKFWLKADEEFHVPLICRSPVPVFTVLMALTFV
jgi:hypothetical protein